MVERELKRVFDSPEDRFHLHVLENDWPVAPTRNSAEVAEFVGDEEKIAPLVENADAILTHVGPVTEKVLRSGSRLRVVGVFRGGPINVNVAAATQRGIPVVNAPGRNAPAVAEFTVGMILAVLRRIPHAHRDLNAGTWRGDLYTYESAGFELDGKVAGIVGLGSVGARVAILLKAFGMKILAYDPYIDQETAEARGAEQVNLDSLLARSDVVSLHARVSEATRGMVDRGFFEKMKRSAILVNTARGALVDGNALADALKSGQLGGAGLDVFEEEPLDPASRLLHLDNVVVTPHIAGSSKETALRGVRQVVEDVAAVLHGSPPKRCINPAALRA